MPKLLKFQMPLTHIEPQCDLLIEASAGDSTRINALRLKTREELAEILFMGRKPGLIRASANGGTSPPSRSNSVRYTKCGTNMVRIGLE